MVKMTYAGYLANVFLHCQLTTQDDTKVANTDDVIPDMQHADVQHEFCIFFRLASVFD